MSLMAANLGLSATPAGSGSKTGVPSESSLVGATDGSERELGEKERLINIQLYIIRERGDGEIRDKMNCKCCLASLEMGQLLYHSSMKFFVKIFLTKDQTV